MDEGFTATIYPNVLENLKLIVDEPVIPEEPASSTGTLYSLQHLAKDFIFGNQFFNDKPSEADNEKTTADTEAESMVSVTIHQDISAIPPMTSPVIDLVSRPDSPNVHRPLPTTTTATATTTTILTTIPLPPYPYTEEKLQESKSYQTREDHMMLYEALEKSMARDNTASAEYMDWTTTDTRIKSSVSPILEELHMDNDTTVDEQAYSSGGEDVGRDHIPTVNLRQSWWKPITEDRPATPEPA
ncbi:hypothetical protein Tco_0906103 [Tanacetum coccineum]